MFDDRLNQQFFFIQLWLVWKNPDQSWEWLSNTLNCFVRTWRFNQNKYVSLNPVVTFGQSSSWFTWTREHLRLSFRMLSEMLFVNYQLKVFHRPANGMVSLNMILSRWMEPWPFAGRQYASGGGIWNHQWHGDPEGMTFESMTLWDTLWESNLPSGNLT